MQLRLLFDSFFFFFLFPPIVPSITIQTKHFFVYLVFTHSLLFIYFGLFHFQYFFFPILCRWLYFLYFFFLFFILYFFYCLNISFYWLHFSFFLEFFVLFCFPSLHFLHSFIFGFKSSFLISLNYTVYGANNKILSSGTIWIVSNNFNHWLDVQPTRVSSSLIGCPIHSALCHIEAKRLVNYHWLDVQITFFEYIFALNLWPSSAGLSLSFPTIIYLGVSPWCNG